MTCTTEQRDGYLRITVIGPCSLEGMKAAIDYVGAAAETSGQNKLAVDTRGVEGIPSTMDRFYSGEYIAKVWGAKLKVAILDVRPRINKLLENTAVNRGAMVLVTPSEDEMVGWLLAPAAAPSKSRETGDGSVERERSA